MSPRGLVVLTLATTACPATSSGPTGGGPTSGSPVTPTEAATPEPAATLPEACAEGRRVDDYRWLPIEARVAASVDLGASDIEAAVSKLSEHARGSDPGVPIDVAFALGQWSWQVPLLQTTLSSAGFQPKELAYARLASGSSAWVFVTSCSFDEATARVQDRWGLEVRRTATGAVGLAPASEDAAFAYDVVFLPADRIALVPAGGATAFEQALAVRADPAAPATPAAGAVLEDVEGAPIRVVVAGGPSVGGSEAGPVTSLRVDAQGVASATLPPQP